MPIINKKSNLYSFSVLRGENADDSSCFLGDDR